jgi:O-antigen/teichoic acid export membrane protein
MLATLVCTPLYILYLGVESYGLIGFYTTLLAIVGVIDSGFSSTASREIARMNGDPNEKGKLKNFFFSLEVAYWPIILVVVLCIFFIVNAGDNPWLSGETLGNKIIQDSISLILFLTIFQIPCGLYMDALIGFQKHATFSILAAVFGSIRTFGVLPFLLYYEDVRIFFLWQILWAIIQVIIVKVILFISFQRISRIPASFSLDVLLKIKSYLGGMFLITALSLAVSQVDKIILSKILTLENFAYYMLATTVALSLSRLTTPIIQVFWPQFSSLSKESQNFELSAKFLECIELLSIALIPLTVIIFIYSEPLLFLWTSDLEITENTRTLLSILIIGTSLSTLCLPALCVLYVREVLFYVIKVNLLALIAIIPLLFFYIPIYGSTAAAFIILLYGAAMCALFNFKAASVLKKENLLFSAFKKVITPVFISSTISSFFYFALYAAENRIYIFVLFTLLTLLSLLVNILCNQRFRGLLVKSIEEIY